MQLLEFKLENAGEVGYFEGTESPRMDGRFRYMPYRSGSHHAMHELLAAGGIPRCYYDNGTTRVLFAVRSCPDYGVLELGDFKSLPLEAA